MKKKDVLDELPSESRAQALRLMPGAFELTDYGNAERLVARYRDEFRYCVARRRYTIWTGRRWAWDETGEVTRMAKATVRSIYGEASDCADDEQRKFIAGHARRSESAGRIEAMLKLAQSEAGVPVLLSDLDSNPWLLNCTNGTVNLRTGQLQPHNRADLITKSTGGDYKPGARSELWDRVLADATGGNAELAGYLQRMAGYSLIGSPLERAFFFLFGPPGTAKSTVVFGLMSALGSYAIASSFDTFCVQSNTGGNRGDLVRLAGARLVACVEVRRGARWDEALVKRITGGDPIVAAQKFEEEVTFTPACTLLFAANDAPAARDDDDGLWVRMRRIPFTAVIPTERQDRLLKERLAAPEHAQAILAWAVNGCLEYQRQGLSDPSVVRESTAAYRAEQDRFGEFMSDCLVFEVGASITRKQLRIAYEEWGKEVGARTLLGAREIARRLRDKNCTDKTVRGVTHWVGVRLRGVTDDDDQGADEAQGADGCTIPRTLLGNLSSRGTLGNGAPKCTQVHPAIEDDPDERAAIQVEGGGR